MVDLTLLPEHRRSGIGSQIAREVFAEADRRGVPVRATVERTNRPSLAFSAEVGFVVVAEDPVFVSIERPISRDRPHPESA